MTKSVIDQNLFFKSSLDGTKISGTLVHVKDQRGVILFIGGSGKTDRDETAPATETISGKKEKLFQQLATALAEKGFSSFRYDKRGVLNEDGQVDKNIWLTADRSHLISDSVDASKFVMEKTQAKYSDLIIIGHSEGTVIGVEAAIKLDEKLRGLILLGAMARSLKDLLYYQIVESQDPTKSGTNANPIDDYKMALDMIKNSKEKWAPDNKPMSWYKEFLSAPANKDRIHLVKSEISIFQGAEDYSTPAGEIKMLDKLNLKNLKTKIYKNLGHCFSPNKDEKPTYGPIDEQVVKDIVQAALDFKLSN